MERVNRLARRCLEPTPDLTRQSLLTSMQPLITECIGILDTRDRDLVRHAIEDYSKALP
jgi:hypothetical protein